MSKRAEEAALKAYDDEWPKSLRLSFKEGYEHAEKDLALTWEDMWLLDRIMSKVENENICCETKGLELKYDSDEEFYSEVLRRFNEMKTPKI